LGSELAFFARSRWPISLFTHIEDALPRMR
jgi:hypothetical protein